MLSGLYFCEAWAYARIAHAQGDIATAVRNLEYVIGYGNRLYVVQQAHALLAEVTAGRLEDESVSVKQQEIRRQSDETAI